MSKINSIRYNLYHYIINPCKRCLQSSFFYIFRLCPLQNKVIASTFKGQKYGDNTQYVLEELRELDDKIDFVWLKRDGYDYEIPSWIRVVSWNLKIKTIYELTTAKVIIDTHRFKSAARKRKGQLYIETWHGGVPIKRLEADVAKFWHNQMVMEEVKRTNKLADVYISQSDFLSSIYRRAFRYDGPIWKCGYPRNDIFFTDKRGIRKEVRERYGLQDEHIMLYAPSFRDTFYKKIDISVYNVDFEKLLKSLCDRFGGKWTILVRWHPLFADLIAQNMKIPSSVIDATTYPDMQKLIMASDALLSDFSSCMFDAALIDIPCFIYATDFEAYKADRGVYFELEELPFTYSTNNVELADIITSFDEDKYKKDVSQFFDGIGLVETGHAGKDIAQKIIDFMGGKKIDWNIV